MSDCDGLCDDCTCAFPPAKAGRRPSKAAEKRSWQQDALFELSELGELYGINAEALRGVR
ncbi:MULTISPECIES: hypothetical protein [Streptomyces]|uniref:hypothetical protein n=1 Tax=Streptomyces TaxID=1883 RepID=UPI001E5E85E2|nr:MULTISPECIES: hypothetical protein [Streptomyces]UFQ16400.1 hypothetical protein J2N69_16105 [Streptomyces huasconensis]WCL86003.1 hypothetical protein PPN52_16110 [Streptomyces sp. JCM 35825]